MVTFRRYGRVKRKIFRTLLNVELFRTTVSKISGRRGMKRMNVKSAHPISAWERISPRM
jgi:hypothetical protein